MTVETETILIKLLEELKGEFKELKGEFKELKSEFKELKSEFKELDQKFEQKFDNLQQTLTDIKITQGVQGEQIKALTQDVNDVKDEIKDVKKAITQDVNDVKDEIKDVKTDIRGRVSIQIYWFLVLISILMGIVGKFAFYPNP